MNHLNHRILRLNAAAFIVALGVLFGSSHAGAWSQSARSDTPDKSTPASQVATPPVLSGRLVFRRADKTLVPIADAVVLFGMGDASCLEPHQVRKEVKFHSDGMFSFVVDESRGFARWVDLRPDGTAGEPYCTEDVFYGCYRFKAKGCEDLIVRYDPKQALGHLFVMTCPGRLGSGP